MRVRLQQNEQVKKRLLVRWLWDCGGCTLNDVHSMEILGLCKVQVLIGEAPTCPELNKI